MEGNDEQKLFWGVLKKGTLGENKLGEILEKVRADLMNGSELENWLKTCFNLMSLDNKRILPKVVLHTFKEGNKIEEVTFENKNFYILGAHP